ncbi:unnamed protein product [Rhizopus stolonifer]
MKLIYFVFALLLLDLIHAAPSDNNAFSIVFYEKPKFKQENGVISGSIAPGGGAGTKKGNITVASFKTQSWLQITLFEGVYWSGKSRTFTGSQKEINPTFHIGSVKWKNLKH